MSEQYQLVTTNQSKENRVVPIDMIFADDEFNCRGDTITPESITELAASIKEHGLLEPIIVQPIIHFTNPNFKYRIVAGYRRFAANKLAGFTDIDTIVRYDLTPDMSIIVNYVENNNRLKLNIMQDAMVVKKLFGLGYTEDNVRAKLDVTYNWLRVRTSALMLPPEVQIMIAADELTQTQIIELAWSTKKGIESGYETEKPVIKAAVTMRDRKARLERVVIKPDVETAEAKEAKVVAMNKDVIRNVTTINLIQAELVNVLGDNLAARALAWACSRITTTELLEDLKIEAKYMSIDYTINSELQGL